MMSSSKRIKLASDEVIDRFLANGDVWKTIFKMLSVKDRIRLEMTNKRLHMLTLEYWKRLTSFDSKRCLREMKDNPSINKNRWAAFVSICVNRIGDGLRSLTIRGKSRYVVDCWSVNLPSIGEGCPNIETINFLFEEEYETLDIRFDSFSRLKTLTVSSADGDFVYAWPSVFLSIPTSIEVIRGLTGKWNEPFENVAQIEGFFADRPSLREVYLAGLYTRDESKADIFRVIAERCPYLKSITLYYYNNCIDFGGLIALESMKQLRIQFVVSNEMEIVTICERSPLVEALKLGLCFSSNLVLQSAAMNALSSLTKLRDLFVEATYGAVVAPSLVTEFVRDLARNSGASLRRLDLRSKMSLPTAAIEALANGCPKLRHVRFSVRVGEATTASIRFLIDCIVAHPSWIPQMGEPTLLINIDVRRVGVDEDEAKAGRAAFDALADSVANLPPGVQLNIKVW